MLSDRLKAKGEKNVVVYDLARNDMSAAVGDAFKYDRLVLATTTYNNEIYPFMHYYIVNLTERCFQNRTVAIIENGSWAPVAAKRIKGMMEGLKDINWLDTITVMSAVSSENEAEIDKLADELIKA